MFDLVGGVVDGGGEDAVGVFEQAVAECIVGGLGVVGVRSGPLFGGELAEEAVPALKRMVDDEDSTVRRLATDALQSVA